MVLDCHIHMFRKDYDKSRFLQQLQRSGVSGGVVISLPPRSFLHIAESAPTAERIERVLQITADADRLFPFYWIDPLEDDAPEQVKQAAAQGIMGFKIICDHFYPANAQAMPVYQTIAELGKPILFHSGILFDGKPSSEYLRPVSFEPLMEISNLRFALAHIAWPWCDELIAVYGKLLNARNKCPDRNYAQLFVDITPGTPRLYRKDALNKLFHVYNTQDNVLFGTDRNVSGYDPTHVARMVATDKQILQELEIDTAIQEKLFYKNLYRFIWGADKLVE